MKLFLSEHLALKEINGLLKHIAGMTKYLLPGPEDLIYNTWLLYEPGEHALPTEQDAVDRR
ncbi:MAG: hypothetical protein BBJ57_12175 [Desulfobacterales bacterium PC51MH44]|nr:MAG: hypothetical protein BBJ57_12175 [Desulfobacterales bacterium PC51MH44]